MSNPTARRTTRKGGVVAALAALAMSLFGIVAGAGPSAATTPTAVVMTSTQMTTGPSLSNVVGWYSTGTHVPLLCYQRGQSVLGYYSKYVGYDNLWYKIADGAGGSGHWAADIDLNTGANVPVTPACASSGRAWGQVRSYNAGAGGQCTWGAYEQFKAYSGVYPALSGNAKDWYASARATGWSTALDAQPNAIVVFQPGVQGAGAVGHVGWVTSTSQRTDGLYVSIIEMNYAGNLWTWHTRTIKDVAGMSYILAPHR